VFLTKSYSGDQVCFSQKLTQVILCVPHKVLLRWSHVGERFRRDMMNVGGTGESYSYNSFGGEI
jgi:hypothetical protein